MLRVKFDTRKTLPNILEYECLPPSGAVPEYGSARFFLDSRVFRKTLYWDLEAIRCSNIKHGPFKVYWARKMDFSTLKHDYSDNGRAVSYGGMLEHPKDFNTNLAEEIIFLEKRLLFSYWNTDYSVNINKTRKVLSPSLLKTLVEARDAVQFFLVYDTTSFNSSYKFSPELTTEKVEFILNLYDEP